MKSEAAGAEAVTAVVLAAAAAGDPLMAQAGVASKALFPLGEKPLVAYLLSALREAHAVADVVLVGPTSPVLSGMYDHAVPGGSRLVDSLALGLGAALTTGRQRLLVCASDIPWVSGAMVDRFVKSAPAGAALVYPVVSEAAATRDFPSHLRTYVRLREGRFTGGNLVLLDAAAVGALLPLIDRAYRGRKNPLALAAMVGWGTLLALLTGTAAIATLEARVSRLLGAPAKALITDDAALAADVDDLSHVPGTVSPDLPTSTPAVRPNRAAPSEME